VIVAAWLTEKLPATLRAAMGYCKSRSPRYGAGMVGFCWTQFDSRTWRTERLWISELSCVNCFLFYLRYLRNRTCMDRWTPNLNKASV